MRKNRISGFIFALTIFSAGCQNTPSTTATGTDNDKVTVVNDIKTQLTSTVSLDIEEFPETSGEISVQSKDDLENYLKKNNLFDSISLTSKNFYKVRFTSDGGAVFARDFTSDGGAVFVTKNESTAGEILWKRTPEKILVDYFQLSNIVDKPAGLTTYGRFSQLVENNIEINSPENFIKKVNLVQSMGFGLVKAGDSYSLKSMTPVIMRKADKHSVPYHIRTMVIFNDKNKLIVADEKKLIPFPGISVSKNLGGNKQKIQVEVVYDQSKITNLNELGVLVSIGNKQFQLEKVAGSTYGGNIEFPEITDRESILVELIDKKSLDEDTDFSGYTWILPVVK